ncbi:hypothetical protein ABW19_dt0209718 [Dactylella cylindrospora]|nr:hypothetical protein ABW19_dt0209718 [Dactylella cylindrospora]
MGVKVTGSKRASRTKSRPTKSRSTSLPTISADSQSPKNWELNCTVDPDVFGVTQDDLSVVIRNINLRVTEEFIQRDSRTLCLRSWCDTESNVLVRLCGWGAESADLSLQDLVTRLAWLSQGFRNLEDGDARCNWEGGQSVGPSFNGTIQQASNGSYVAAENWWIDVTGHNICVNWSYWSRSKTARPKNLEKNSPGYWVIDIEEGEVVSAYEGFLGPTISELNKTRPRENMEYGRIIPVTAVGKNNYTDRDCFKFWCDGMTGNLMYLCESPPLNGSIPEWHWGRAIVLHALDILLHRLDPDLPDREPTLSNVVPAGTLGYRAVIYQTNGDAAAGQNTTISPKIFIEHVRDLRCGHFEDAVKGEAEFDRSPWDDSPAVPTPSGTLEKPDFRISVDQVPTTEACEAAVGQPDTDHTAEDCPGSNIKSFQISDLERLINRITPGEPEAQRWVSNNLQHEYPQPPEPNENTCYSFTCDEETGIVLSFCGKLKYPGYTSPEDLVYHKLKAIECCIRSRGDQEKPKNCPPTHCSWSFFSFNGVVSDRYVASVIAYVGGVMTTPGRLMVQGILGTNKNCSQYIEYAEEEPLYFRAKSP